MPAGDVPEVPRRSAELRRPIRHHACQGGVTGRAAEEFIRGSGAGSRGGTYVDITAVKDAKRVRIQTVDTLADGVTPTANEAAAAARIRARYPGGELRIIPKTCGEP
jgi:hypothetical protein